MEKRGMVLVVCMLFELLERSRMGLRGVVGDTSRAVAGRVMVHQMRRMKGMR
jgi:hypothetical protein